MPTFGELKPGDKIWISLHEKDCLEIERIEPTPLGGKFFWIKPKKKELFQGRKEVGPSKLNSTRKRNNGIETYFYSCRKAAIGHEIERLNTRIGQEEHKIKQHQQEIQRLRKKIDELKKDKQP